MQNHGLGRLVQQFKLKLLRRYRGGRHPPHNNGNSFVACSLPKVLHAPAECVKVVVDSDLVILARMTQVAGFTHTQDVKSCMECLYMITVFVYTLYIYIC